MLGIMQFRLKTLCHILLDPINTLLGILSSVSLPLSNPCYQHFSTKETHTQHMASYRYVHVPHLNGLKAIDSRVDLGYFPAVGATNQFEQDFQIKEHGKG